MVFRNALRCNALPTRRPSWHQWLSECGQCARDAVRRGCASYACSYPRPIPGPYCDASPNRSPAWTEPLSGKPCDGLKRSRFLTHSEARRRGYGCGIRRIWEAAPCGNPADGRAIRTARFRDYLSKAWHLMCPPRTRSKRIGLLQYSTSALRLFALFSVSVLQ